MISNGMGLIEKINATSSPSHNSPPPINQKQQQLHQQQQQQQQKSLISASSTLDLDAGKFINPNFSSMLLSSSSAPSLFASGGNVDLHVANALLNNFRNTQATAATGLDTTFGNDFELQQEKWRNYFQVLIQQQQQQQQQQTLNCKFYL